VEVTDERDDGGSRPRKPKGLTREEFEALLAKLHPDRERAGELYENIRCRLIRLFEWRGCAEPEALADVAIDRVARRFLEGIDLESRDPYGYFCGVANLVFKEDRRSYAKEQQMRKSGELPLPIAFPDEEEPEDCRLECLRRCLDLLPADQRVLVLRYHQGGDNIRNRKMLSDELGLPLNALRIRVHRVRRKLEACVRERLRP
jgi:DNA-directed RNA polymerase specialized sigma24 family protein